MGVDLGSEGGDQHMMSGINITPFVDVMLVLLIIFMVTTPMIEEQEKDKRKVDIDLPVTRQNANHIDPENTDKMILIINEKLEVKIGKVLLVSCEEALTKKEKSRFETCFDAIEQKLGENAKLQEDKELYILADTDIPYGFVVGIMGRIKKAGIQKLGMVTNPEYLDEMP